MVGRGASLFYSGPNWALSSTGDFVDDDTEGDDYTITNTSALFNMSGSFESIYQTARVSPLSLTYYGLCLFNGEYSVKLYFAEIVFSNDESFNSLGRRIFNVYIQVEFYALRSFGCIRNNSTAKALRRFDYCCCIYLGQSGLKDFDIAKEAGGASRPIFKLFNANVTKHTLKIHFYWAGKGTTGIPVRGTYGPLISAISVDPTGVVVVAAALLYMLVSFFVLRRKGYLGGKLPEDKGSAIRWDNDCREAAIHQVQQGCREFVNEIGMISSLQHPISSSCMDVVQKGTSCCSSTSTWKTTAYRALCLAKDMSWIARGLRYLHEESTVKIVHRDIKASNVLLDKDMNAKISDFGLAKLNDGEDTHISTRIAGTVGYMAPEYAMRGYLTSKADAYVLQERGSLLELVDPDLGSDYPSEEAIVMLNMALMCTDASPSLRPTMSQVISMLKGKTAVEELDSDPGFSSANLKIKSDVRSHFWRSESQVSDTSILTDSLSTQVSEIDESLKKLLKSPYYTVMVGVKDNICAVNMPATAGSRVLDGYVPPFDATAVKKVTANPWDTSRVPGGSSGGSAAAVSARQCVVSLGSDTGGSVRQPASFCGVVGLKPTYGRVSRYGLMAYASSLDVIGCFGTSVADAGILLHAISGHDKLDATCSKQDVPDFTSQFMSTSLLDSQPLKGLKIGLIRETVNDGVDAEVISSIQGAASHMEALGCTVTEVSLPSFSLGLPAYYILASSESSSNLSRYDGVRYGNQVAAEELNNLYGDSRAQGFGPEVKMRILMGTYALSAGYYDAYYKRAQQVRTLVQTSFKSALAENDILISPAAPSAAYKIGEKKNDPLAMYAGDIMTGETRLPVGVQMIGAAFDEEKLLRIGHIFEQTLQCCNFVPPLADSL
ncbi:unnamed protein product [Rhodiola kirilowii]